MKYWILSIDSAHFCRGGTLFLWDRRALYSLLRPNPILMTNTSAQSRGCTSSHSMTELHLNRPSSDWLFKWSKTFHCQFEATTYVIIIIIIPQFKDYCIFYGDTVWRARCLLTLHTNTQTPSSTFYMKGKPIFETSLNLYHITGHLIAEKNGL